MRIVFLSNYLNHHQVHISDELYKMTDGHYRFVATSKMSEERRKLGYPDFSDKPYLIDISDMSDIDRDIVQIINDADVVIIGSAPDKMIIDRIRKNKLTFRYAERFFKKRPWYFPNPKVW